MSIIIIKHIAFQTLNSFLFVAGLTLATMISLPVNDDHLHLEGKRLSFQLFSLRENVAFKKLGVYGRKKPRKSLSANHAKPANVNEPISLTVKSDSPPPLSDKVMPATLPDLPKPAADKDDTIKPDKPPSTNSR